MQRIQRCAGISVIVEAISFTSADASKLTALLQPSQGDSSDMLVVPAVAVFTRQNGGVIQAMQDLFEKAESQLEEAKKAENKDVQA